MKYFINILIVSISFSIHSQNTVGTITNENGTYDGFTLFTPNTSKKTYLINNCGEIINEWTSAYNPGNSCYLLENGNLLRAGKIANSSITFGGVGGKIQLFDWDNNLLWEYTYSSPLFSQHHDVYPLPNGNVLMLAVNTMDGIEAIDEGRDPSLILEAKIFNEQIIELEPSGATGANVIWEWNIKDHIVQDFDVAKNNYGVIKDHPELLDFNFLNNNNGNANWLHFNSIQYNANLDQIIISSRHLSEVYIIDHSTSTAEAASHSGGIYGKGGDFLYRWGNPIAYNMGDSSNQTLFSQHYPHWIPDGLIDAGKILVFSNGNSIRYSAVNIFSPPTSAPGFYNYDTNSGFGPISPEWTYTDSNPSNFFSSILSSAQRLTNGNTLICDGDSGYFFEIDNLKNIVWEYRNPDTANGILSQGDTPSANLVFRAIKYPRSYPAFNGKDLTPGNQIELNPNTDACTTLSKTRFTLTDIQIFPNPSTSTFNIKTNLSINKIELFDAIGQLVNEEINTKSITVQHLKSGMYFLKIYSNSGYVYKKVLKK